MPQSLSLAKILINGIRTPISAADVVNAKTGKTLDREIDAIQAAIANLSGAGVEQLKSDLAALKLTLETFLTGEENNNGVIDTLKEITVAIAANKDSLDAILADKATKEALDAVIERVAALEGKNWTVLDGISKNETTGNLIFNGKELTGETGIAIGTSVETATVYNGKIQIILEEIEIPDEDAGAA